MAIDVLSPTTGLVIEVKVSAGDKVAAEDEMVIVESMKMHIPVTAPSQGTVQLVRVHEGDQVNEDDVVAVIA